MDTTIDAIASAVKALEKPLTVLLNRTMRLGKRVAEEHAALACYASEIASVLKDELSDAYTKVNRDCLCSP